MEEETQILLESLQNSYKKNTSAPKVDLSMFDNLTSAPLSSTVEVNIPISETHVKLNDGTYVAKYDTYKIGEDNNELYAQAQSTSDKWSNGVLKFLGKTGTAVVGNILGSAQGLYEFVQSGSEQAVYDNSTYRWLDDWNTKMDINLPNYYTQQEQNAGFFESMGTANFWANDFLGGLSFTTGAIASELLLTKGAGLVTKLSGVSKASRLPQLLSNVSKAKKVVSEPILKTFTDGGVPFEGWSMGINKGVGLAKAARFMYTSSGYEASVETLQFRKEQEESFNQNFLEQNGRLPNMEEIENFNSKLNDASNSLWLYNTVVTGSTNMMQMGAFLGMKTPSILSAKWANKKFFGAGLDDVGKAISPTKYQKVARRAVGILKNPSEEAFQEGFQAVGSSTAEKWMSSTLNKDNLNSSIDLYDAFGESITETFTTQEGLKEVLLGALIGGVSGSAMGLANRSATTLGRLKQIDKNAKDYQTYSEKQIPELIAYGSRVQEAEKDLEVAERSNDFLGMEQARKRMMLSQIAYVESLDYAEEGRENIITGLRNLEATEIAQNFDVTIEQAEQYRQDMIDQYNKTFDSYKRHKEFAESYIGNNFKNAEQVHSAVATALTLGETAYDYNQTTLDTLKNELGKLLLGSDVLDIKDTLEKATTQTQNDFANVSKELQQAQESIARLEAEQKELLRNSGNRELQQENAAKLNSIALDITDLQQKKVSLNERLNNLLQLANLENPYSNKSPRVVTEQDLTKLDEVLQNLSDLPSKLAETDTQKAIAFENLIREYNKSNREFKSYAELSKELSTGKFDAKGLAEKVFGDRTLNEALQDILDNENNQVEEQTSLQEIIKTAQVKKTEEIVPEDPIGKFINLNPYLKSKGVTSTTKPTPQEIVELEELRGLENTTLTSEEGQAEVQTEPLTEEQQVRKDELESKMEDWELYDSFLNEGLSLSDIIDIEGQLGTQPEQVVPQEVTTEELGQLTEQKPSTSRGGDRYEEISQTYDGVQIRETTKGTFVHNTNMDNFLSHIDSGVVENKPDATHITFEDGTTATVEVERPGVLKVVGWENIENNTSLERIRYKHSKNSYSFVYSNGQMMQTELDTSVYNFDAVYDLKEGSTLSFRVDNELPFNQGLTEDQLQKDLKIYIVDSKGNIVGDVKSDRDIKGTKDGFKLLRKKAVDTFKSGGGIIPIQAKVSHIYLGTPVFTIENGVPIEQSFDNRSVVDWGYYSNGNFELTNSTENIRTSFVQGFNRRVPVVVFRRGSQLVAFPVNLKTTQSTQGTEIVSLFNDPALPLGQAIKQANQMLLDNGFPATLYYRGQQDQNVLNNDGSLSENVIEASNKLNQTNATFNFLDVQQEQLNEVVSSPINFGSNPITSPKIVMDFDQVIDTNKLPVVEEVVEESKKAKVDIIKSVEKEKPNTVNSEIINQQVSEIKTTSNFEATKRDIEKRRQEELTANVINEQTSSHRRPNGSIGTQGFTPESLKNLVEFINKSLNLSIPNELLQNNSLKPLIEYIKNNKELVDKITEYVKSDPIEIQRLPDGTLHFEDGNHRANLLNLIGSQILPVIESNKQKEINAKYDAELRALDKKQKSTNIKTNTVESSDGNTYKEYSFTEGATQEDFRSVLQEGARVYSPTNVFVYTNGRLKSTQWGNFESFPQTLTGWIVSVKVEKLSDVNTKSEQNKKC